MKKSILRQRDMDMKSCRLCRYYLDGGCVHPKLIDNQLVENGAQYDEWFNHACEEGRVQETLEEALQDNKIKQTFFNDVINLVKRCGLNSKKVKDFESEFSDVYDVFVGDVTPFLDDCLNRSLTGYELDYGYSASDEMIYIDNPFEHYCCYWE